MVLPEDPDIKAAALAPGVLAGVFMSLETPLAVIALDGRIVSANTAFTTVSRHTAGWLDGRRLWEIIGGPNAGAAAAAAARSSWIGGAAELDVRMVRGDGSIAPVILTLKAFDQPQLSALRLASLSEPVAAARPIPGEDAIQPAAFAVAIHGAPIACVITDTRRFDNPITSCNPVFAAMTGYTPEEAIGRNWRFLHGPDTDQTALAEIREAAETGTAIRRELLFYRKDGTAFTADLVINPVNDAADKLAGMVGLLTDVTALRQAEAGRRDLNDLVGNITSTMPGFVFQRRMTRDGILSYTYVSPSFRRLVKAAPDDPSGALPWQWLHPDDVERVNSEVRKAAEGLRSITVECRLIAKDGETRWIRSTSRPVSDANGGVVWNGVAADITSEKSAEGRLSYLVGHDHLTGLLNRQAFRTELAKHVATAQAQGGMFAVLVIDISDFQTVNDAFGTAVGDRVLQVVGDRAARFEGARLAARVGGNEFAAVLVDLGGVEAAVDHAHGLRQQIAASIEIDERRIATNTYMGLALYPANAPDPRDDPHVIAEALIKAADLALLTAKSAGPGSCHLYSPDSDDRVRSRAVLQHSLFEAYEKKQFVLHYQPVVELETGRILGAEALIRWNHPELGMQRPDHFIPLAEKTGLIVPIGAWVLEEVIRCLSKWDLRGVGRPWIALNVAAAQLQRPETLEALRASIVASGFDATRIEIELTESEFIDPTPAMLANLASLREMGVRVAIDDFGTGYSSFRYLRSLPVDKIKIDQSFISRMTADSGDEAIVRGMIAIGQDLGLSVVAEGVETVEQRDILLHNGCDIGQGYYYSRPIAEDDFARMLTENRKLPASKHIDSSVALDPATKTSRTGD